MIYYHVIDDSIIVNAFFTRRGYEHGVGWHRRFKIFLRKNKGEMRKTFF